MKKTLLVTSALVAAGLFSTEAFAQAKPMALTVGGYWGVMGVVTSEDNQPQANAVTPAAGGNNARNNNIIEGGELHLKGSLPLDNGITVGFRGELELATDADQIDELWVDFSGSFGRLILGQFDPIIREHTRLAPTGGRGLETMSLQEFGYIRNPSAVGAAVNGGGVATNASAAFGGAFASTIAGLTASDGEKIHYISPNFSGFTFALAYMPDSVEDNNNNTATTPQIVQANGQVVDYFGAAAIYNSKLGDVGVNVALAWESGKVEGTRTMGGTAFVLDGRQNAYTASGILSFAGFDVGGGIKWLQLQNGARANGAALLATDRREFDQVAYDAGVAYTMGAVKMGLTYMGGTDETLGQTAAAGEARIDKGLLSASYLLGPGVTIEGGVVYERLKFKSGAVGTPDFTSDGTSFLLVTNIAF